MPQGQHEDSTKKWKSKAMDRSKENAILRKRLKEITQSREAWKSKYMSLKNSRSGRLFSEQKAKGHHYSLSLVTFLISLYGYGSMSLRSCQHTLRCLSVCLGLEGRIPSHTSVRNWLCKSGLHRLTTATECRGDYIVWVDESICFGSEKILLILGINEESLPKDRGLCHSDMEVLYVDFATEWKGEQIAKELENIGRNKTIKYAVSDEGLNLRKAYKSLNLMHIEDCTHVLANYLKKLYAADAGFQALCKLVGIVRQKWTISKDKSQYMPPIMRGKMRFANIFPCVNWAKRICDTMEDLPSQVSEQLIFLKTNQALITSLVEVEAIFKTVCEGLKNKGFGTVQKKEILSKLAEIHAQQPNGLTPKSSVFMENVKAYLETLTHKSEELQQNFLLCSSDIIESYFGKFKTKINPNSRSGLTEFIFTIATFGKQFSVEETKTALETIKCKEMKLGKRQKEAA